MKENQTIWAITHAKGIRSELPPTGKWRSDGRIKDAKSYSGIRVQVIRMKMTDCKLAELVLLTLSVLEKKEMQ